MDGKATFHRARGLTAADGGLAAQMVDPCAGNGISVGRLAALLRARDIETAWAESVAALRELGFSHVYYANAPAARDGTMSATEELLVLSTLPRPEMTEVMAQSFHDRSPLVAWALRNAGVIAWNALPEPQDRPRRRQVSPGVAQVFQDLGIAAGCTVGFADDRTRGSAAMALGAAPGVSQRELAHRLHGGHDAVFVTASVAHRILSRLPWVRPAGSLTQRQREVLEWLGEGKTTADIACIMGLTPATVEKHLRLARQCLGVETSAHALIKATFFNQLYVRQSRAGAA